ncbi:MAG: hypothetical protein NDI88_15390, partial [Lysobacter sp.]|nr:hypothetical protein [Lysobacter sp.]
LVVVTGRLLAKLSGAPARLPVGEAAWGDTRVGVPGLAAGTAFVDVLTGERVAAQGDGLAVRDLLAAFPAAVLLAEARPAPLVDSP